MNPLSRALFSVAVWAALLAPGAAQFQLKVEPLPPVPLLPPAQREGLQLPARRVQVPANAIINHFGGGFVGESDPGGASAEAEPDPAGPQRLDFANGHRLHGTLEALDLARGQLTWRRADARGALTFPLAQIHRLHFDGKAKTETAPAATVKFTGGDWLAAEVTAIQGDKIHLRLGDGARLSTDRAHVEWIYFSKSGAAECYDGPTSLSGWTSGGGWSYRDGALRATSPSPISRSFRSLPDQVEYRLTVDQGPAVSAFTISLHGWTPGEPRTVRRGLIQLMLRTDKLILGATIDGNFRSQQIDLTAVLGRVPGRPKGPMFVRVLEDFTGGRILVFINNRLAGEWRIDSGEPGKNGGLFQYQPTSWSGDQEQSISRIQVLPWDGREAAEDDGPPGDRVSLPGAEAKKGRIVSWDGRTLKLEADSGAISVPRDRLALLRLRRPENPPDDEAPVAHVRLVRGGEFDAVALGWQDGKFQVRTNFGGELTLAPAAVAELELRRATPAPAAPADLLVFKNGDRLRGWLEGAGGEASVRWKTAPDGPAVEFASSSLAGLQFATRLPALPGGVAARFRNGDWLAGALVGLDREQLRLETTEAGPLTIPRALVQALYFGEGAAAVSDGASDHALWERGLDMSPGASARRKPVESASPWSYFAGSYVLARPGGSDSLGRSGGVHLGRTFPTLPGRVEVSFTVSAQRSPVFCSGQLFTEPANPGFTFHLSSNALSLYDMNPRTRARGVFQQQFPFSKEIKPDARQREVRVLADRISGRMAVLVDGVLVGQVNPKPADGPRNLGRGVMIMPQSSIPCAFSNFWIGPWDGRVPGREPRSEPAPETVALANGDEARGVIELAMPAGIKVTSEVGPLDLPLERLTMIDLGGPPAQRNPAGTRLQFAGQGALTVGAWRIENETVVCRSEIAGDIKLPLAQVQEIIFPTPPPPKPSS